MTAGPPVIDEFYAALADRDIEGLTATLSPDFVGHVTASLPHVGGTYVGPQQMLAGAWRPAVLMYGVTPRPRAEVIGADGQVVVFGSYVGRPPAPGVPFEAEFTHSFRVRDGRIVELRQLTDSHAWATAVAPERTSLAVATQVYDAVRNRDADALLDAYASDITIEEDPSLPYGGTHHGHEGAMVHSAGYIDAWDRLQPSGAERDPEERLVASGDTVVAIWTLRGKRGQDLLAVPATSVLRVEAGHVQELRMHYADSAAITRFLAG